MVMMLLCVPVSWFFLFLCWFGYYVTYPRDAASLRAAMAACRRVLRKNAKAP